MGLIADTQEISARNLSLLQHRVFNMRSLQADLAIAGMRVIDEGGYLVKPFTHAQMEQVSQLLGGGVLDGLFHLGREMPELASEIFVEVVREARD